LKGTIKKYYSHRGIGFIETEEVEDDIILHYSQIQGALELEEGQEVEFEVEPTSRGLRAVNLQIIE
jgi:cold shock CspA family protein